MEPSWEQSGSLGIKERRSWQTWQLAVAVFVAILLGMGIGHTGGGGNSQASSARGGGDTGGGGRFVPPPPSGSGSGSASTTSTSVASSTTSSAVASATPGTLGSGGADQVLLPKTTGAGARTLATFTATGPWKLGWAFQCASAPTFQIVVVSEGSSAPSQPAVDKAEAGGQGVSDQTTTGRVHLEVRAGPSCRWAVKASGAAG